MGDQLRVDLDALGRLLPQLRELAQRVEQDIPGQLFDETQDMAPSLAAAQDVSTITLPAVRRAVADQFTKVAQLVEDARLQLLTSDEHLPGAANNAPTPPPTLV